MTNNHSFSIKVMACGLVLVALFASCRKEPIKLENPNTTYCTSYVHQFQTVWEGLDHIYVLWERDTVDWDARYAKYLPVFQEFDARMKTNPVDSAEYHKAWKDVTKGLLDHHLTMLLYNPNGKYRIALQPGSNSYSHARNWEAQTAALKQVPGMTEYVDYYDPNNSLVNSIFCLLPGKTQGKYIAYFRLSAFSIGEMADSSFNGKAAMEAPLKAFYGNEYLKGISNGAAARADVESIIIDLRGNPGGSLSDISPAIGSLMQDHFHWGYTRTKMGLGRLDYSGWTQFDILCPENHLKASKPVVVLADINTVSCGEISTYTIKMMPFGKVIGERTYGGTCALVPNTDKTFTLFYSGCFGDQNLAPFLGSGKPTHPDYFEHYVYSGTYDVVNTDYKSFEGVGVQPDIEVLYDANALKSGVDNQLNRALEYLRTGN